VLRRIFSTDHDIIATNRMNLPVGKPVVIFLSSKAVIHSFGLPQMRVKQDAIPGIVQPVWFTPTKVGQWDVARSVWMPKTRTLHAEAC
jgi:cytochrome c oxidase subunit II